MQLKEINYADPTIYHENGYYYMSGTKYSGPAGFSMLVSKDLKIWYTIPESDNGNVLTKDTNVFGSSGFWAPQFYKAGNEYCMAYTADEYVAVAKSDKITGPFVQSTVKQVDSSARNIDPFVFRDDDGKYYLYHVRFGGGNFIYVAEFNPATNQITTTPKNCFKNTQAWEKTPVYDSDPIMEGPTVLKRNGIYYLFYSANHFKSIDYAVGYATAKSPLGPWTKYNGNPIIHKDIIGENGTGHGDIFFDKEGIARYIFHVHKSETTVDPRKTRIIGLNFTYNTSTKVEDVSADTSSLIIPLHDTRKIMHVSPEGSATNDENAKEITYDLAGKIRKQGSHVDIGAYEYVLQSHLSKINAKGTIQTIRNGNFVSIYNTAANSLLQIYNSQGTLLHTEKKRCWESPVQIYLNPGIYIFHTDNETIKISI